jgi:NAD(P)H-nitrite reductase large subunit
MEHIVIVGNGVAGITAARHIRKMSERRITVISAESDHFYSRTALMYIYMGHMTYQNTKPYEDWFWEKNRIELVRGYVEMVDTEAKTLLLAGGERIRYDRLIIATGSQPNRFGWPGEALDGVQGFYSLQDLEAMERNTRGIERGVIVGGGLIGIEVAEMLRSRRIPVTFLVREQNYWDNVLPIEEARMINRHVRKHGVDLRIETELAEILPDENGRVRAVVTSQREEIPCGFVALTAGVSPNIDLARRSGVETSRGVLVNEYFETSVPDVYAAGDCAEFRSPRPGDPAIEQLWYTGRMHGESLARIICAERRPYDRGIWFNSAKFFDIEYQTYGRVGNVLAEDEATLYWEHPDGRRAIRINYARDDHRVLGFNLMGIRYRQAVCERWIREGRTIEHVLENLGAANFDPEFFPRFEAGVAALHKGKRNETRRH